MGLPLVVEPVKLLFMTTNTYITLYMSMLSNYNYDDLMLSGIMKLVIDMFHICMYSYMISTAAC